MNERVRTGIHVVWTVESIFPYLNLERKSEADRSLESRMDELLSCSDGCKLEQKLLDTVKGPDENPRHPDGWNYGQMSVRTG
jgi:hypothetical protein